MIQPSINTEHILVETEFCPSCSEAIQSPAKFCRLCGTALTCAEARVEDSAEPVTSRIPVLLRNRINLSGEQIRNQSSEFCVPHPWLRFWARSLDGALYFFLACVIAELIVFVFEQAGAFRGPLGEIFYKSMFEHLLSIPAMIIWWFIEALNLSAFGSTLGKWMFGIKILEPSGARLSFRRALARAFQVWLRGLYCCIPYGSCFGQIQAWNNLSKNGITSWDARGGYVVQHERIGILRLSACMIVTVPVLLIYFALWILNNSPVHHYK